MNTETSKYDSNAFQNGGTGDLDDAESFKIVIYPFDKYEIKVKLSYDNKFLGITEIKINKEFLSHKQKFISKGFHDVEDLYNE